MDNTQLTTASGYKTSNMIFSKPEVGNIPGSALSFKRIRISTKNNDGTTGDLVLETPTLFSFGVQESTDMNTGNVNGYTMPLCMWSKDGVKDEEKTFTDTFNEIVEYTKKYIMDHKDDIEKYDLDMSDLKKLNPLYWKREKGKIVEGVGPTLYSKLLHSKKDDRILTVFYNSETGEEFEDPLDLLKKYCHVNAAIKFESIFIGNKISLQIKLYEASVQLLSSGPKRLLSRPKPKKPVPLEVEEEDESSSSEEEEEGGSLGESSEEEEEEPIQQPKKKRGKK